MKGLERYERIKQIQVGSFGSVWLCHDKVNNIDVAMKECDLDEFVQQEIKCLTSLKHPNIIKLLDKFQESIFQYLILEYAGEDLHSILEKTPKLDMKTIQYIMKNILEGLSYIHENGYIHRDIKPSNVMVSDNFQKIKLIDFGYCRKVEGRPLTPSRFTNQYAPLDCLLGMEKYNEKMDVWGAGCIFGQMLKGDVLFQGDCQISVLMEIIKILGTPTPEEWPEMSQIEYFDSFKLPEYHSTLLGVIPGNIDDDAIDLLKRMLTISQSKRISAKEALQHKFFKKEY